MSADGRCLSGEHHRAEDQRRTNSAGKCHECHDNSNSEQCGTRQVGSVARRPRHRWEAAPVEAHRVFAGKGSGYEQDLFPHVYDVLFKKNFVVLMLNRGLDPRPILSDFRIFCGANLVLTRSFRRVRFSVAMLQAISSHVDIQGWLDHRYLLQH